jgi:hypothetical protein
VCNLLCSFVIHFTYFYCLLEIIFILLLLVKYNLQYVLVFSCMAEVA